MLFNYKDVDLKDVDFKTIGIKKIEDRTTIECEKHTFTIVCSFYPHSKKYQIYAMLDHIDEQKGIVTKYTKEVYFKDVNFKQVTKYINFLYVLSSDEKLILDYIELQGSEFPDAAGSVKGKLIWANN